MRGLGIYLLNAGGSRILGFRGLSLGDLVSKSRVSGFKGFRV